MNEAVLSVRDIAGILPHRYPFLLVDRVIEKREINEPSRVGSTAKVIKNVTFNEPFFTGHFPEQPVMPGVLILEAMAQGGALAYYRNTDPSMDVAIASVRDARFRSPVVPGDTLVISTEVVKDRKNMILLKCVAHVDGKLVAQAELLAFIGPKGEVHS